ncbi:MAG TPA: YitT family protein, partial [Candidatus Egerieenecus merdigallinarum]|nr:YitT family protein [Candidatus Egerieenecus merdigallinarum]
MERAKPQKQIVKEWLLITLGIVFLTVGVYFFKFPNNFSTGGVSGLSVILAHYIP